MPLPKGSMLLFTEAGGGGGGGGNSLGGGGGGGSSEALITLISLSSSPSSSLRSNERKSSASVDTSGLFELSSNLALRMSFTTSRFLRVASSGHGSAVYGSGLDHLGAALADSSASAVRTRFLEGSSVSDRDDRDDISISSSSSSDSSSRSRNFAPSPVCTLSSGRPVVTPDINARSEGWGGGCQRGLPGLRGPPPRPSLRGGRLCGGWPLGT